MQVLELVRSWRLNLVAHRLLNPTTMPDVRPARSPARPRLLPARVRAAAALVLAGSAVLAACITPSIPIPPPDQDGMTFEMNLEAGTATFSYEPADVFAGAVVYIFNRDVGRGVIETARADGSVGPSAPVPAAIGDQIVVTFDVDGEATGTCVVLDATGVDETATCAP